MITEYWGYAMSNPWAFVLTLLTLGLILGFLVGFLEEWLRQRRISREYDNLSFGVMQEYAKRDVEMVRRVYLGHHDPFFNKITEFRNDFK